MLLCFIHAWGKVHTEQKNAHAFLNKGANYIIIRKEGIGKIKAHSFAKGESKKSGVDMPIQRESLN